MGAGCPVFWPPPSTMIPCRRSLKYQWQQLGIYLQAYNDLYLCEHSDSVWWVEWGRMKRYETVLESTDRKEPRWEQVSQLSSREGKEERWVCKALNQRRGSVFLFGMGIIVGLFRREGMKFSRMDWLLMSSRKRLLWGQRCFWWIYFRGFSALVYQYISSSISKF